MKHKQHFKEKILYLSIVFMTFFTLNANAQYTGSTSANHDGSVINATNAVDPSFPEPDTRGNLSTFATLPASSDQNSSYLKFKFQSLVPAGKTTYVRISPGAFSTNSSLLELLVAGSLYDNIVAPITDKTQTLTVEVSNATTSLFTGNSNDNFNLPSSNNSIKVVQDNAGNYYLAIYSTQVIKYIKITNQAPTTIGATDKYDINVHGAFYKSNSTPNNCNTLVYTSWDGSDLASIDLLTNSPASNISNFIDGDFDTFSSLNTGTIGVAATTTQTVYLEDKSNSTDKFHITLRLPTGLLSLGVAQNITFSGYEGETFKNSITLSQLLDINLLNLENNEKVSISYNPGVEIDNIRISISSLVGASLLSGLELYEISKNTTLVTTEYATSVTPNTATLNASLENDSCLVSYGFEYSTDPNFTLGVTTVNVGSTFTSNYSSNISGLTPGKTYYYRATTISKIDGVNTKLYGNIYSFYTGDITWNGSAWSNITGPDATDSSNGIAILNGNYSTNTNGSLAVHDLTINNGFTLSVENLNSLTVSGSITASDESIDASEGEIIFIGDENIILDGDVLKDQDGVANNRNGHQINKVQVNTDAGVALQIFNEVEIMTSLTLGEGNIDLQDNADVIFNSDANGTAFFGEVGGVCTSSRITYGSDAGFTVERYIPAGSEEGGTKIIRAYRMLTSPVNAGTINSNWQEGDIDTQYNTGTNSLNNIEGYGTHITGNGGNSNGFDYNATGNTSIYTYNNKGQQWDALPNTNATNLNVGTPYYINIRGDRTLDMSTNNPTPISTTLRAKGTLKLCEFTLTSADLADSVDQYNFFGNPYQAPIDMNEVLTNANTQNINSNYIWVWDPNIGTKGAYVVIDVTDDSKSNTNSLATRFLQAGQGAFVANSSSFTNSTTPQLSFEENDKNIDQNNLGVFMTPNTLNKINIQLKAENKTLDAITINFNNSYSNSFNDFDALKLGNTDENLAIRYNNNYFTIEKRNIPTDQELINLYVGNYKHTNYQFVINWNEIPNTKAFLVDNYLQTSTLLNDGENTINFSIDESLTTSVDTNRFHLLFTENTLSTESNLAKDIYIYPNPINEDLAYINLPKNSNNVEIKIYNQLGKLLTNESYTNYNDKLTLNMAPYNTGIYFIEIKTDDISIVKKVIKQ